MAIEFSGVLLSDQYINVGDVTALDSIGSLSASVWARTNSVSGGASSLRYVAGKEGVSAALTSFLIRQNNIGGSVWEFFVAGAAYVGVSTSATSGVWTHLCGVYNGSDVVLYKDGVLASSAAKTGNTGDGPALEIASGYDGENRLFDGLIEDVRVYDRALSVDEAAILAAGYRGPLGGEVVWLPLSDSSTLSAVWDGLVLSSATANMPDRSNNANNGTPQNGPVARAGDAPRMGSMI